MHTAKMTLMLSLGDTPVMKAGVNISLDPTATEGEIIDQMSAAILGMLSMMGDDVVAAKNDDDLFSGLRAAISGGRHSQ